MLRRRGNERSWSVRFENWVLVSTTFQCAQQLRASVRRSSPYVGKRGRYRIIEGVARDAQHSS
jgi:hypothetical protein